MLQKVHAPFWNGAIRFGRAAKTRRRQGSDGPLAPAETRDTLPERGYGVLNPTSMILVAPLRSTISS